MSPLTDSMVKRNFKKVLLLLQLQHHHFIPLGGLGPLGLLNMGSPLKSSSSRALGPLSVFGGTYRKVIPPLLHGGNNPCEDI